MSKEKDDQHPHQSLKDLKDRQRSLSGNTNRSSNALSQIEGRIIVVSRFPPIEKFFIDYVRSVGHTISFRTHEGRDDVNVSERSLFSQLISVAALVASSLEHAGKTDRLGRRDRPRTVSTRRRDVAVQNSQSIHALGT
jgi:hypothetical protein